MTADRFANQNYDGPKSDTPEDERLSLLHRVIDAEQAVDQAKVNHGDVLSALRDSEQQIEKHYAVIAEAKNRLAGLLGYSDGSENVAAATPRYDR